MLLMVEKNEALNTEPSIQSGLPLQSFKPLQEMSPAGISIPIQGLLAERNTAFENPA